MDNLYDAPKLLTADKIPNVLRTAEIWDVYLFRIITKAKNTSIQTCYYVRSGPSPGLFYKDELDCERNGLTPKSQAEIQKRSLEVQARWDENERLARIQKAIAEPSLRHVS